MLKHNLRLTTGHRPLSTNVLAFGNYLCRNRSGRALSRTLPAGGRQHRGGGAVDSDALSTGPWCWCPWRESDWGGTPCGGFAGRPTNGRAWGWLGWGSDSRWGYGSWATVGSFSPASAKCLTATSPISYETLQPDPNLPAEPIPQSALDMQDKRVYIKGYMKPRSSADGHQGVHPVPQQRRVPVLHPQSKTDGDDSRAPPGRPGNHLHEPPDRGRRPLSGRREQPHRHPL